MLVNHIDTQDTINLLYCKKKQEVQVFRSDSLIFSIDYQEPLGNTYGIQYFFVGNGEVDYFYLWYEQDSLVVGDDFD